MGFFADRRKTKEQTMTALLPVIINNIFAQTQKDGFENAIKSFEMHSRYKFKRSNENMCEFTIALLALQLNQWNNVIKDKDAVAQCAREALIMLSSSTVYTIDQYEALLNHYTGWLRSVSDPRELICNQLFLRLEPEPESFEKCRQVAKLIQEKKASLAFEALYLFAFFLDILKIHEPFMEHMNNSR